MNRRENDKKGFISHIVGIGVFVVVLAIMMVATLRLSASSDEEGLQAVRDAIQRSAVLCYATEGYYPPSLDYIEVHYGVQIDHSRYVVRYDVFASNIMPEIYVFAK